MPFPIQLISFSRPIKASAVGLSGDRSLRFCADRAKNKKLFGKKKQQLLLPKLTYAKLDLRQTREWTFSLSLIKTNCGYLTRLSPTCQLQLSTTLQQLLSRKTVIE